MTLSAYPTPTIAEAQPTVWLSSYGEPDSPAINSGEAGPTNLAEMFYPAGTAITFTQGTASNQPIYGGRGKGWELGGDDWFDSDSKLNFLQQTKDWWVACEYSYDVSDQRQHTICGNALGLSSTGWAFQIDNRNGDREVRLVGNGVIRSYGTNTAPDDGAFHIYEFASSTAGGIDLFIDGSLVGNVAGASDAGDAQSNFNVGTSRDEPSVACIGYMRTIVVADNVPSTAGQGDI